MVEAWRAGTRPGGREAARVGGAGLPARVRPPRLRYGRVLGAAPAVPVHPGLAQRAVVGPVPATGAHRRDARRAGRMAHPAPGRHRRAAHTGNQGLPPLRRPLPRDRRQGSAAMSAGEIAEQAHAYARHGWPVFPCQPGGKRPATRHGFLDATADPDKIAWWWRRQPDANVAIATGEPGPDVLDVDQHGEAGSGFAALNRLKRAGLVEGASAIVSTPSGGLHLYFAGTGQRSGKLPRHHLDFRAQGGYIVAPPSQVAGRPYRVVRHQARAASLDWGQVTTLLDPDRDAHPPGRVTAADLSRLAGWVGQLAEGNRNDGLFWAACRAAEAGDETVLADLAAAARWAGL